MPTQRRNSESASAQPHCFHSFKLNFQSLLPPSPSFIPNRQEEKQNKKQKTKNNKLYGSVSCTPSPGSSMVTRPLQSRLHWSQLVDLMVAPSSRRCLARDRSRALYDTTHRGGDCLATCVRHQEFHNSGGDRRYVPPRGEGATIITCMAVP